jgi:hypothetical protein
MRALEQSRIETLFTISHLHEMKRISRGPTFAGEVVFASPVQK